MISYSQTKYKFLFTIFYVSIAVFQSFAQVDLEKAEILNQIEAELEEAMALHQIPGLALGIIKNDSIWYQGFYGETLVNNTVTEHSVFKAFSISELVVTTAVFKYIDKGIIKLNNPISHYLENTPSSWKGIQVKHLLAQTSGIHQILGLVGNESNWAFMKKLKGLPLDFQPGEKYEHNEINYYLLGEIISIVSQKPFDEFIEQDIFNLTSANALNCWFTTYLGAMYSGKNRNAPTSSMVPSTIENMYNRDMASNGLNSSLKPLLEWILHLNQDVFFSSNTKQQMWKPYPYKKNDFNYLYGWNIFQINKRKAYGISSLTTSVRIFPEYNMTLVLLTNGYKYYPIQNELVNIIAGFVEPELKDENELLFYQLSNQLITSRNIDASSWIDTVMKNVPKEWQERFLRGLGNKSLHLKDKTKAYDFFSSNTKEFPNSIQAHKDLSNLFLLAGQYPQALEGLKRIKQLDPNNTWATEMITRITKN